MSSTATTPSSVLNFNPASARKPGTDFKLISDDSGTKTVDVSLQLDSSSTDDDDGDDKFDTQVKKLRAKRKGVKKPLIIVVEKKRINESGGQQQCGEKRAAEGGILEEIQMQRKRIKINNNVGSVAAVKNEIKGTASPFKFLTEKVKVKGF